MSPGNGRKSNPFYERVKDIIELYYELDVFEHIFGTAILPIYKGTDTEIQLLDTRRKVFMNLSERIERIVSGKLEYTESLLGLAKNLLAKKAENPETNRSMSNEEFLKTLSSEQHNAFNKVIQTYVEISERLTDVIRVLGESPSLSEPISLDIVLENIDEFIGLIADLKKVVPGIVQAPMGALINEYNRLMEQSPLNLGLTD